MSTRTTPWEPGTPAWADLATADVTASTGFYAALFGWQVVDLGPEYGHYALATLGGLAAAGLGPIMGEGQPGAWTTFLAVTDADRTAEAVGTHGGAVVSAPMDVGDRGRTAVAVDPTGAAFGVWQAGTMIGAQIVNEPGGVVWNDHNSADPGTARAFYAAVFDYTYTPVPGQDYTTIDGAGPGDTIGGIGAFSPGTPQGTPAHWMVYFGVADVDAACATATGHGGTVVIPAWDTPFGRMATLSGPEGAVFTIGSGSTPP